jgi:TonB family protein
MRGLVTSAIALLALSLLMPVAHAIDVGMRDTDTERKPLHTVVPDYPKEARRDRLEGEVQVCFKITRNGAPWRIAVRKSTNRVFEKAALKAVRESTFVPLLPGEEASNIKACRTFRFYLERLSEEDRD